MNSHIHSGWDKYTRIVCRFIWEMIRAYTANGMNPTSSEHFCYLFIVAFYIRETRLGKKRIDVTAQCVWVCVCSRSVAVFLSLFPIVFLHSELLFCEFVRWRIPNDVWWTRKKKRKNKTKNVRLAFFCSWAVEIFAHRHRQQSKDYRLHAHLNFSWLVSLKRISFFCWWLC